MPSLLRDAVQLCLLTLGYRLVDLAVRQDGFPRLLGRAGLGRKGLAESLWVAACLASIPFWGWDALPRGRDVRTLAACLAALLAWQAVTKDVDPATGETHRLPRIALAALAAGTWFSPACLLAAGYLFTVPFGLWQHHATLPMRLFQALMAHAVLAAALAPLGLFRDVSALVFFLLAIAVSHYLITALAKCMLGPKWHSWVTDNRIHHLAASAYSWGWARFLPWPAWRKVISAVRCAEKPLQAAAFALELLSPLAFLRPGAAFGFCCAWAGFHLGVFALSGLLFWDWILADLALAFFIVRLPETAAAHAFGPAAAMAALAFLAAFPLRHKLWKPMPLGWFDTPFTQRIHWRVRGASGTLYGLYNDFMCPHERLYGKVNGCFLVPGPVITYHLGEVWKPDLRDAIRAAGPDAARMDAVKERFGIRPVCARRAADHAAYLRRFFFELNRGARKHVLPRPLRWLKAPGDQIYYWGDLPPYRGQERAVRVTLHYREDYFDGRDLIRLRDEQVADILIGDEQGQGTVREATPKEIDDFLLAHAAGRLIDLPGFGGGYVGGDDGRRAAVAETD
ncbi:MAG TPA: hypothetical protein VJ385_06305 [Fibrobacteria bacterium]|nr:hypothetical protein [Fibrobacteria bacterium]